MNKTCPHCGASKPLTDAYWHHHKTTKSGWHSYCKQCRNTDSARRYRVGHLDSERRYAVNMALVRKINAYCKERARRVVEEFKRELRQGE